MSLGSRRSNQANNSLAGLGTSAPALPADRVSPTCGYPVGYHLFFRTDELCMCLRSNERRSNDLYFVVFKPHRLFVLRPLQLDEVITERLFQSISNRIDGTDGSFQPPKRTVAGNPYQTTRWQDVHPICLTLLSRGVGFAEITQVSWNDARLHLRNHNQYCINLHYLWIIFQKQGEYLPRGKLFRMIQSRHYLYKLGLI